MKVLIDRMGLQAQHHLKDKQRLSGFITELIAIPYPTVFSSHPSLTEEELNECDVLVITTRWPDESAYLQTEIGVIRDFIHGGGGLLLMSNHGDWPGDNPNDTRRHDAKFARDTLGITIERTFFKHPLDGARAVLSGPALSPKHPIITGSPGEEPVRSIVTNTCCSIVADRGDCVVSLSSEMVDKRKGYPPHGRCFAHALDAGSGLNPESKGRVITVADSGFIGTDGSAYPGQGLIGHGDNLRFIKNVIRWLGGELGP